jgi:alkanesulfonate monooxygenase SsuD/methylene tetrahydromethanopterin reductase-like flavin-dependent oxidoreductase (luciferase family)
VKHAVNVPPFGVFGDVHAMVDLAVSAEESGWDGFFLWDHILYADDVPFVDAWIALTAIAAATSRIRIGPMVTALARRRPWKVAREAVTLDHFSNGRLILGVGLGIDFWREFSAFPGEVLDDTARAELVDDGIEIITKLWTGERVSYEGRRLSVDKARFLPTPLQQPRIPIWAAALWPPSKPGPVRRAARADGVTPFKPASFTPDDAARVRDTVAAERRNDDFPISRWGEGPVAGFEAAGVTWMTHGLTGPAGPLDTMRQRIAAGPPER